MAEILWLKAVYAPYFSWTGELVYLDSLMQLDACQLGTIHNPVAPATGPGEAF